jgi:predicted NBD/HSP70 family sugar kinase
MAILAMDLGGTKLASAVLDESGAIMTQEVVMLEGRKSTQVGALITDLVHKYKADPKLKIRGVGVSVPGNQLQKRGYRLGTQYRGVGQLSIVKRIKNCCR